MRVYTGHADTGFELGCLGLSVLIPGYGLALKPWDQWIGSNTHPQIGAPGLKGLKHGLGGGLANPYVAPQAWGLVFCRGLVSPASGHLAAGCSLLLWPGNVPSNSVTWLMESVTWAPGPPGRPSLSRWEGTLAISRKHIQIKSHGPWDLLSVNSVSDLWFLFDFQMNLIIA